MNDKRRWIMEQCNEIALWDGFDEALIGIAARCGSEPLAVYDRDRMIQILAKQMAIDDAVEYLDFNVVNAHIGPLTPMILDRIPPKQKLRGMLQIIKEREDEVTRLRDALTQIAEHRDEPYSADFAKDILNRRVP
jgi:hypothetical protein